MSHHFYSSFARQICGGLLCAVNVWHIVEHLVIEPKALDVSCVKGFWFVTVSNRIFGLICIVVEHLVIGTGFGCILVERNLVLDEPYFKYFQETDFLVLFLYSFEVTSFLATAHQFIVDCFCFSFYKK